METINKVLKVLFHEVRSEDVIHQVLSNAKRYSNFESLVDKDIFARQMLHIDEVKTLDQAEVDYQVLHDKWALPNEHDYNLMYSKESNLFNILLHFTHNKILFDGNTPVCKYCELFSWHEITRDFGEDMFVTSYLAAYDLRNNFQRKHFDWDYYLKNDARELNDIFSREMYDLHSHLYGSSLNFELNWLCLMNVLCGHEASFAKLDDYKLFPTSSYRLNIDNRPLYVKVLCAAIIRLYLYLDTISEDWSREIAERLQIKEVLKCQNLIQMLAYANTAQEYIDTLGFCRARQFVDTAKQVKYIPDYAIINDATERDNHERIFSILGGERRLMYKLFCQIYSDEYDSDKKCALFYIYLLIKSELRKEMVQSNRALGFENFSDYQNRKYMFIPYDSVYDQLLTQLAVGSFTYDADNRYVEMRIVPRKSMQEDARQIMQNDLYITGDSFCGKKIITKDKYDYIYHFIKQKDGDCNDDACRSDLTLLPRHHKLRTEIERQARGIYSLIRSKHDAAKRVVGIDAANSEIYCRPEVFARAYRYLSIPLCEDSYENHSLGLTYHVGEDFYDVVDGLRAVDEVLTFLRFQNGSRLGHALVLGTNVSNYYERHNFRINATQQVLLDNVVWLYVQAERLGCSTKILAYLNELYVTYYHRIYPCAYSLVDIFSYYQSWLLRGDSPYCYQHEGEVSEVIDRDGYLDDWNKVVYNNGSQIEEARNNKDAVKLNCLYHYNMRVRCNGAKSDVLVIKPQYRQILMETIEQVQQELLQKIERKHIAIECNPSSNLAIGNFLRYDEHPILKFYNHGLTTSYPRHTISVSINTDDAGIFSTSLEREYSLMALDMEKRDDENTPRDVMEWLEHIRLMTKEQKFHD